MVLSIYKKRRLTYVMAPFCWLIGADIIRSFEESCAFFFHALCIVIQGGGKINQ